MTESRLQGLINAPLEVVWELVVDPDRQEEWWPATLLWESGKLELGCKVRHIAKRPGPMPDLETTLEVQRFAECEELLVTCLDTGTFTYARLQEAQGGTFLELVAGNQPKTLDMKIMNATVGKRVFRSWVQQAMDRLRAAAEEPAATPA
jgi:uncharacterized protein YndB with AHSA1/START domain